MPDEEAPRRSAASPDVRWALAVFAVSVAVFLPTLPYPFLNWDDPIYVTNNAWLYDLTWERLAIPFRRPIVGAWTPLPVVAHIFLFQVAGLEPAYYRLLNILCHGAAMVGAFAVMRALGARAAVAASLTALVAVHPLRIESVVWVSELKDVLCNAFYLWALWKWIVARDSAGQRAASLLLFALALMSKPMAVSFPLVVVLHDALLERGTLRRRIPWYAMLAALAIAASVVNMGAQKRAISEVPLLERIEMATYGPLHYAQLTAWPFGSSPLYPREFRPTQHAAPAVAGFVACLGILAAAALLARKRPAMSFGILSAGAAYGPVSGIIAFSYFFAADRFTYLPTALLAAGCAPALSSWLQSGAPGRVRSAALAWVCVLLYFAAATAWLSPVWKSPAALWGRVAALYPESKLARQHVAVAAGSNDPEYPMDFPGPGEGGEMHLANALAAVKSEDFKRAGEEFASMLDSRKGLIFSLFAYRRAKARSEVMRAVEQLLESPSNLAPPELGSIADALAWAGEDDRARALLETIDGPTNGGASALGALARRELDAGNKAQALADAREALRQIPGTEDALYVVARCGMASGDRREAERLLRRGKKHPASNDRARRIGAAWLGAFAVQDGRQDEARQEFEDAFETAGLDKWTSDDISFLGWQAEEVGQPMAAVRLYELALSKNANDKTAIPNLAILRFGLGEHAEAIALMERAVVLWPDDRTMAINLARMRERSSSAPSP